MSDTIKNALKRIAEFYKKTDKKKLIIIGIAVVLVIVSAVVLTYLLNRTKYTVLFSGLSAEEAGSILTKLDEMGVSAKADGTDTILVPEEQADDLRMQLAGEGYPQTGLNYDLFSGSSALGTTDLQQQTYLQYQLQENMRTTINRMSKVKDSLVIVNLASSSSYVVTDNSTEARVAVLLNLEGTQELTTQEARTVGQFVLKCVPKLKIENISIVDSNMNYYNIVEEDRDEGNIPYSDTMQELTQQLKDTLKAQVLTVLEPAIGKGNVAVSVNLNLNFDKETVNSIEYAPPIEGEDQGMLSSSEETSETASSGSKSGVGQDSTDEVNINDYSGNTEQNESKQSQSRVYNYELNQIETQIEKAQGKIEKLSVAVLVNSNIEGVADYMDNIGSLVSNAIGVSRDSISVELMPFADVKGGISSFGTGSFDEYFDRNQKTADAISKNSLIKTGITWGSILIIVLFLLNLIARRTKILQPIAQTYAAAAEPEVYDEESMDKAEEGEENNPNYDALLKNMKRGGPEVEMVERLINEAPEAVIQTLRSWLTEDD